MTYLRKHLSQTALVGLGIVFMILGVNNNTAFIAIGAAFIAIGAASARRRKASSQVSETET